LKFYAIDTDVDSVSIAKENATLNGIDGAIDFQIGSLNGDTPKFDFICANLTLDVILPILSRLVEKAGKTLVLSGILAEQQREIVNALGDFQIIEPEIKQAGEWISVVIAT
jgi:ribosomal protein L11 methyltransferase